MEFLRKTNIDFLSKRRIAFICSGFLILVGLVSLIFHGGPRYSIDFIGGMSIRVKFQQAVSEAEVREALNAYNLGSSEVKVVQEFGGEPEILIRVKQEAAGENAQQQVEEALTSQFPDDPFEIRSVDKVGPKIGAELRSKAMLAIIITLVLVLTYLSWRFEFRFGVGAVAALFHDVIITLGIFSLLNLEISLAVVAAFLTIVGYSLNDTIVVFDRIRENLRRKSGATLGKVINMSINQTLSRTVITSGTTFMVVFILYVFGGQVIHDFAFALLVGIIIGTYSSIYIASPILLEWGTWEALKKKRR